MLQQANLIATKQAIIDTGSVDMQRNNRLCKGKKVGAQRTLSKALYPNVCSLTEPSTQQCQPCTPALCTPQLSTPPLFSSETQCSASIRRRASRRALLQSLAASNGRLEISLCVTHLSESLAFCCGALLHRVRLSMRASSLQVLLSVFYAGEVGVGVEGSGVSGIKKRRGDLNFFL